MATYRIKRFGLIGAAMGGPMTSGNNPIALNKLISDQDFKNGNYGQWAKHAFLGVSLNTRNLFLAGTYGLR